MKDNTIVEELLDTPVPRDLWHYTTMGGFEGILNSGRIWATEVHATSDATEFIHLRDVGLNFFENLPGTDEYSKRLKDAGRRLLNEAFDSGGLSSARAQVFIASFSDAKDLKSQWMDYAERGSGVSLAFDLAWMRPPGLSKYAITLAPCRYRLEEKEQLLEASLSHIVAALGELKRNTEDGAWVKRKLQDWMMVDRAYRRPFDRPSFETSKADEFKFELQRAVAKSSFDLLRIASHCKHKAFSEEREWRLALPRMRSKPLTQEIIEYRNNGLTPYIALHEFQQNDSLPLTHVLLGPLCINEERVHDTLQRCGYSVPVTRSEVPLRNLAATSSAPETPPAPDQFGWAKAKP